MMKDPIVEEMRAVRAQMLKQAGGTLDGLAAMLRQKRKLRPTGKVVAYKFSKPVARQRAA
jgi:hypothetical protein